MHSPLYLEASGTGVKGGAGVLIPTKISLPWWQRLRRGSGCLNSSILSVWASPQREVRAGLAGRGASCLGREPAVCEISMLGSQGEDQFLRPSLEKC